MSMAMSMFISISMSMFMSMVMFKTCACACLCPFPCPRSYSCSCSSFMLCLVVVHKNVHVHVLYTCVCSCYLRSRNCKFCMSMSTSMDADTGVLGHEHEHRARKPGNNYELLEFPFWSNKLNLLGCSHKYVYFTCTKLERSFKNSCYSVKKNVSVTELRKVCNFAKVCKKNIRFVHSRIGRSKLEILGLVIPGSAHSRLGCCRLTSSRFVDSRIGPF